MSREIKILIGEENSDFASRCASEAEKAGYTVKICPPSKDGILNGIKSFLPDFVLCEAFMPGGNAADLIWAAENFEKMPFFIVTSEYKNAHLEREIMSARNAYLLIKPFEPSVFIGAVKRITPEELSDYTANEKSAELEAAVMDILIHQAGIPANVKGYRYLKKAVVLSVGSPEMLEGITKQLYPTVARSYDTTPSRVERAIRHAIEMAWNRCGTDELAGMFGCASNTCKPTNSEFIAVITDKLRLKFGNAEDGEKDKNGKA